MKRNALLICMMLAIALAMTGCGAPKQPAARQDRAAAGAAGGSEAGSSSGTAESAKTQTGAAETVKAQAGAAETVKAQAGAAETVKAQAAAQDAGAATTVEIKEKLFIQQCNDVYNNPGDYMDKTILIEGLCDVWEDENGNTCYAVYRNTPGCCGADGQCGFEFTYDGTAVFARNDWIRVAGTPKLNRTATEYEYLTLTAASVEVMAERGAEFVSN